MCVRVPTHASDLTYKRESKAIVLQLAVGSQADAFESCENGLMHSVGLPRFMLLDAKPRCIHPFPY